MQKTLLLLSFCVLAFFTKAQDSTKVFPFSQFLELVNAYHPVAKQALLARAKGDAQLREARGGFDPKIFHESDRKDFKDTPYYFNSSTGIKVPIWFGLELKGQYDLANGNLLNPENTVPNTGLTTVGASFTPLKGLFIDQRRADLKTAKIYRNLAQIEQQKIMNKLFQRAAKAYWKWSVAAQKQELYTTSYNLYQQYVINIRSNYENGDKSAFDTLEAYTQMQKRYNMMMDANRKTQIARASAASFLWTNDESPVQIPDSVIPISIRGFSYSLSSEDSVAQIINQLENRNPELVGLALKVQATDIKRRLAAESLKPDLKLNYNFINEGFAVEGEMFQPAYFENNYKWGIDLTYPILIRKARGKLQQVKIEKETLELEQRQRTLEIKNDVQALLQAYNLVNQQLEVSANMVENFNRLFQGETTRFLNGESDFFLVNQRELYYLDETVKLLELNYEQVEIGTEVDYLLGTLPGANYFGE